MNCLNTVNGAMAGPYVDLVGFFNWMSQRLLKVVSLIAKTSVPVSFLNLTFTSLTLSSVTHCVPCCEYTDSRKLLLLSVTEISVVSRLETDVLAASTDTSQVETGSASLIWMTH